MLHTVNYFIDALAA
jgi:DNA repair protein RadC